MWGERKSNSNENVELGRLEFAGRRFAINPQKILLLGRLEDTHLSLGKLIPLELSASFPEEYQTFCDTLSVDVQNDDPVKIESARKLHNTLSQVCYNTRLNKDGQSLGDCFLMLYKDEYLSEGATRLIARIGEFLKEAIDNFVPFGLLVLPRSIDEELLERIAHLAFGYKVQFLVDLDDISILSKIDTNKACWSSTAVFWNQVKISDPQKGVQHSFYLSPTMAILGGILREKISQPVAGFNFGHILRGEKTKWSELNLKEISELDKNGINPMITREGQVYCMGCNNLYRGKDSALSTYPNTRVLRFIEQSMELFFKFISEENTVLPDGKYLEGILNRFFKDLKDHKIILRESVQLQKEDQAIKFSVEIGVYWRILDVHYDLILKKDMGLRLIRTQ